MRAADHDHHELPSGTSAGQGSDALAGLAPVVDVRVGRNSAGGNEPLFRRLLRMFRDGQRDAIVRFRSAREQGEASCALRHAHNLRSTAATLGMTALAASSRALELAQMQGASDAAMLADLEARAAADLADVLSALAAVEID